MIDPLLVERLIEKIPNSDWGDTKMIPIDYYDYIRHDISKKFKRFHYVVGVYEFGKVSNPGISDLDLAVVFDDCVKIGKEVHLILKEIYSSKIYRQVLCGGTVMIFQKKDFQRIALLDDVDLACLYGDSLEMYKPTELEERNIKMCQVVDWLPERLASLAEVLKKEDTHINSILGYLYSLRYTFKITLSFNQDNKILISNFINKVEEVRNNWSNRDEFMNKRDVVTLIVEAFHLGCLSINNFSIWMNDNYFIRVNKSKYSARFMIGADKGFYSEIEEKGNLNCIDNSIFLGDKTLIMVPQ